MNLDLVQPERSIIMKKRENNNKVKFVENQFFDVDGNLLTSMKNSFINQSLIGGSIIGNND